MRDGAVTAKPFAIPKSLSACPQLALSTCRIRFSLTSPTPLVSRLFMMPDGHSVSVFSANGDDEQITRQKQGVSDQ
jgi:hypothetical protein